MKCCQNYTGKTLPGHEFKTYSFKLWSWTDKCLMESNEHPSISSNKAYDKNIMAAWKKHNIAIHKIM